MLLPWQQIRTDILAGATLDVQYTQRKNNKIFFFFSISFQLREKNTNASDHIFTSLLFDLEWFVKPGLGAGELEFVEVGELDRCELSSSPTIIKAHIAIILWANLNWQLIQVSQTKHKYMYSQTVLT